MPQPELLATLIALGFDESSARRAAALCSSVEGAVDLLSERPREVRSFSCPLCFDSASVEAGVCLDCEHSICNECFSSYCHSKIREGQVTERELVCPARCVDGFKLCGKAVTVDQVRGAVDARAFDRFLEMRVNKWEPSKDDGHLLRCPSPDCCQFVVCHAAKTATCPKCRAHLCAGCGHPVHAGLTCEEATSERRREHGFEAFLTSQGFQRCPCCHSPTERTDGCFFMQCPSQQCQGQIWFCYLCGEQLPAEEHFPGKSKKHFPKGPYNDECVNITQEQYRGRHANSARNSEDSTRRPVVEEIRRFFEF